MHPERVQAAVRYPDLVYRVREGAKLVEEVVFPLAMRCYFPDDFASLFAKHGFDIVERWGGYSGESYGIGPELIIQARPAASPKVRTPTLALSSTVLAYVF